MTESTLTYPIVPLKYSPIPIQAQPPAPPVDRELEYILNLHQGMKHREAGIQAGYSPGYVDARLSHKRFNPAFIQRYFEVTRCSFAYLMSNILKMDTAFISKISKEVDVADFQNYTKSTRTLERIAKLSGFVRSEVDTHETTINIGAVQNLLLAKHQRK